MLVTQPYDGAPIDEIRVDDEAGILEKLDRAARCFADRPNWLPPFRRIEILRRLARLMEREFNELAMLIAREGGKPLIDARAETARAINGVDSAIGDLEHLTGREIPMNLTAASQGLLGVYHAGTEGRGRGDLRVQSSAEPRNTSGDSGDRHGLSGDYQTGDHDAAHLPALRGELACMQADCRRTGASWQSWRTMRWRNVSPRIQTSRS